MNRYSKRINPSFRPQIERIKGYIRAERGPFDGDGYPFKKALSELRKEGYTIKYDRINCHYIKI